MYVPQFIEQLASLKVNQNEIQPNSLKPTSNRNSRSLSNNQSEQIKQPSTNAAQLKQPFLDLNQLKQPSSNPTQPKQPSSNPTQLQYPFSDPAQLQQPFSNPAQPKQSFSDPAQLQQPFSNPAQPKQSFSNPAQPKQSFSSSGFQDRESNQNVLSSKQSSDQIEIDRQNAEQQEKQLNSELQQQAYETDRYLAQQSSDPIPQIRSKSKIVNNLDQTLGHYNLNPQEDYPILQNPIEFRDLMYIGQATNLEEDIKPIGLGRAIIKSSQSKYEGEFYMGFFHGLGRYISGMQLAEGHVYVGQFEYSLKQGWGIYVFSDGTLHKGNWNKNQPFGQGTRYYHNGDEATGNWAGFWQCYEVTYVKQDGQQWKGDIVNGQKIKKERFLGSLEGWRKNERDQAQKTNQ